MPVERIGRGVEFDGGELLDVFRVELLYLLALSSIPRGGNLCKNPLHPLRQGAVEITAEDRNMSTTIQAAACGDSLAISAVSDAEDSPDHRRE